MYVIEKYLNEISLWGTKQGKQASNELKLARDRLKRNPKDSAAKRMLQNAKTKGRRSLYKKGFMVAAIGGAIDAAVNKENTEIIEGYRFKNQVLTLKRKKLIFKGIKKMIKGKIKAYQLNLKKEEKKN